jgi:CheY-like chemotaxis protein
MLINYCKTDEDRKNYATKIKRNADNLTELINDILDLSKVEAGALKIEHLRLSLADELDGTLSWIQDTAHEKGLGIETIMERPLPTMIISDPKRLRQILTNVIGNAIKFTESGKISVRVKMEGKLIAFCVEDTGCGISAASQQKLFEPFVQADSSTTRKYGGTGLGLALSRRLARALGGDLVLVESVPNKGSVFKITISAGDSSSLHSDASSHHSEAGVDLKGLQILLAEDQADNAHLISTLVTKHGGNVVWARDGQEAVAQASRQTFDIILMDLQMPVLDGYKATKQLREAGTKTPIIALTAHAMSGEKEKCLAAGFSAFLTKPLNFPALLGTLQQLTSSSR